MRIQSVSGFPAMARAVAVALALLFHASVALAVDADPVLNNGAKWRIGYYEGGAFSDYTDTMHLFVKALAEQGWIRGPAVPDQLNEMPNVYWDWLCQCDSPYLSFRPEDAYSAEWSDTVRARNREEMLQKLRAGELDLVIAMGTWAGVDLAVDGHSVPVLVMSTSDPVRSGIIKSMEDSGRPNVTARVDPNRYVRQIRMFHRIVRFRTLGVAYEDTEDGRVYAAMAELKRIGSERGFSLVWCRVRDVNVAPETADASCMACYRKLADEADAIYITPLTCVDRMAGEIAEVFRNRKKPSFAMIGSKLVEEGFLMSISSDSGYARLGRYNAEKFGKILNGAKPEDLSMVLEDPLEIAINLETANKIGFVFPGSILRIAAEIYGQ